MSEPTVTFFITTARSGTQWTASTLNKVYSDLLLAEHEPLGYRYEPRKTLRDLGKLRALLDREEIRAHFDRIHRTIERRSYAEVGFPAFALAPLLREEFGARLRLVQLTRDPVKVAASVVTHRWFEDGRRQDIKDAIVPRPGDPGAALAHYAARWPQMSAFERALIYWYQVHSFGLEQEAPSPSGTFARFQFEKLIADEGTQDAFFAFLGLPKRDAWQASTAESVDNQHRQTYQRMDWGTVRAYPEILELAERLGYSLAALEGRALAARYQKNGLLELVKSARRSVARAVRRNLPASFRASRRH